MGAGVRLKDVLMVDASVARLRIARVDSELCLVWTSALWDQPGDLWIIPVDEDLIEADLGLGE